MTNFYVSKNSFTKVAALVLSLIFTFTSLPVSGWAADQYTVDPTGQKVPVKPADDPANTSPDTTLTKAVPGDYWLQADSPLSEPSATIETSVKPAIDSSTTSSDATSANKSLTVNSLQTDYSLFGVYNSSELVNPDHVTLVKEDLVAHFGIERTKVHEYFANGLLKLKNTNLIVQGPDGSVYETMGWQLDIDPSVAPGKAPYLADLLGEKTLPRSITYEFGEGLQMGMPCTTSAEGGISNCPPSNSFIKNAYFNVGSKRFELNYMDETSSGKLSIFAEGTGDNKIHSVKIYDDSFMGAQPKLIKEITFDWFKPCNPSTGACLMGLRPDTALIRYPEAGGNGRDLFLRVVFNSGGIVDPTMPYGAIAAIEEYTGYDNGEMMEVSVPVISQIGYDPDGNIAKITRVGSLGKTLSTADYDPMASAWNVTRADGRSIVIENFLFITGGSSYLAIEISTENLLSQIRAFENNQQFSNIDIELQRQVILERIQSLIANSENNVANLQIKLDNNYQTLENLINKVLDDADQHTSIFQSLVDKLSIDLDSIQDDVLKTKTADMIQKLTALLTGGMDNQIDTYTSALYENLIIAFEQAMQLEDENLAALQNLLVAATNASTSEELSSVDQAVNNLLPVPPVAEPNIDSPLKSWLKVKEDASNLLGEIKNHIDFINQAKETRDFLASLKTQFNRLIDDYTVRINEADQKVANWTAQFQAAVDGLKQLKIDLNAVSQTSITDKTKSDIANFLASVDNLLAGADSSKTNYINYLRAKNNPGAILQELKDRLGLFTSLEMDLNDVVDAAQESHIYDPALIAAIYAKAKAKSAVPEIPGGMPVELGDPLTPFNARLAEGKDLLNRAKSEVPTYVTPLAALSAAHQGVLEKNIRVFEGMINASCNTKGCFRTLFYSVLMSGGNRVYYKTTLKGNANMTGPWSIEKKPAEVTFSSAQDLDASRLARAVISDHFNLPNMYGQLSGTQIVPVRSSIGLITYRVVMVRTIKLANGTTIVLKLGFDWARPKNASGNFVNTITNFKMSL